MRKLLCFVLCALCFVVTAKAQTCTDGQVPVWSSTTKWTCASPAAQPLPVGSNLAMTVANASVTGTTANKFAKLTGAPSTAVISSNGDTENAIGICISGCGTTGNAVIAIIGQVSCVFDGATTAGNYVTIAATGGGCHDAGSSYPSSVGAAYGRVLSTNGGAGTYVMELMTPDIAFQNGGNGKSKPGGSTTQVQYNNAGVFAGDSSMTFNNGTLRLTVSQLTTTSGATFAAATTTNLTATGIIAFGNGGDMAWKDGSNNTQFFFKGSSGTGTGGLKIAANQCFSWSDTNDNANSTIDTALCKNTAGILRASTSGVTPNASGSFQGAAYLTGTNCSDSAGAAACGAAAAGSVVIDAGSTSVVVSTTAVTANSQIFVQYDSSLGTRLSVTCNTTPALPSVTARTAATSFTITVPAAPITNPACYSYFIVN